MPFTFSLSLQQLAGALNTWGIPAWIHSKACQGDLPEPQFLPLETAPFKDQAIQGVSMDSRALKPGWAFILYPGSPQSDILRFQDFRDHPYGKEALQKEALLVLDMREQPYGKSESFPPEALEKVCHLFFKGAYPQNNLAITGTNGKSSIVHYLGSLLGAMEKEALLMGTLGIRTNLELGGKSRSTDLTTLHRALEPLNPGKSTCPDMVSFYHGLALGSQLPYSVLEASSHGLSQGRFQGFQFQGAVFTNFSQDHLDYHGDMDRYWEAKMGLFRRHLSPRAPCVAYQDIPRLEELETWCQRQKHPLYLYGHEEKMAAYPQDRSASYRVLQSWGHGQKIKATFLGEPLIWDLPLIGAVQVENLLATLLLLTALGLKKEQWEPHLQNLTQEKGRMEKVPCPPRLPKKHVFVDFAHSPQGLEKALSNLKDHLPSQPIGVVFGCGGNRDASKRPLMGEVASRWADYLFITDDNPRWEDPGAIREQVIQGALRGRMQKVFPMGPASFSSEGEGPFIFDCPDREKAIQFALEVLPEGGGLLIAGKGHEQGQIIRGALMNLCDKTVVRSFYQGKETPPRKGDSP